MPAAQINPSSSVLTAAVSIERERPDFPSDKKRRDALVLLTVGWAIRRLQTSWAESQHGP